MVSNCCKIVVKDVLKKFDLTFSMVDLGEVDPVVILSSQDQIEVAVDCMQHKAHDYVVKNEIAFLRLQKIIDAVFKYKKMEKRLHWLLDRS